MTKKWTSIGTHTHPDDKRNGAKGKVCKTTAGEYIMDCQGAIMSCPQEWAATIHAAEEAQTAIIIRTVPMALRRALKGQAAAEGRSMQDVVIRLIRQYIA